MTGEEFGSGRLSKQNVRLLYFSLQTHQSLGPSIDRVAITPYKRPFVTEALHLNPFNPARINPSNPTVGGASDDGWSQFFHDTAYPYSNFATA